jgi:hypothetical protein
MERVEQGGWRQRVAHLDRRGVPRARPDAELPVAVEPPREHASVRGRDEHVRPARCERAHRAARERSDRARRVARGDVPLPETAVCTVAPGVEPAGGPDSRGDAEARVEHRGWAAGGRGERRLGARGCGARHAAARDGAGAREARDALRGGARLCVAVSEPPVEVLGAGARGVAGSGIRRCGGAGGTGGHPRV